MKFDITKPQLRNSYQQEHLHCELRNLSRTVNNALLDPTYPLFQCLKLRIYIFKYYIGYILYKLEIPQV